MTEILPVGLSLEELTIKALKDKLAHLDSENMRLGYQLQYLTAQNAEYLAGMVQAREWSAAWKVAAKRYRKELGAYDRICDEGAKREIAERSQRLRLQTENAELRDLIGIVLSYWQNEEMTPGKEVWIARARKAGAIP